MSQSKRQTVSSAHLLQGLTEDNKIYDEVMSQAKVELQLQNQVTQEVDSDSDDGVSNFQTKMGIYRLRDSLAFKYRELFNKENTRAISSLRLVRDFVRSQ